MRTLPALLAACAAVLALASRAWAQATGQGPIPPEIEETGQLQNWLLVLAFLAALCIAVFKKSKRTQLD